jgi:pyruvate kinase
MIVRRKTKIICTIGPATKRIDDIRLLIENGMDFARLNFSHGSHDEHQSLIDSIREAAVSMKTNVPIIGDICGPKIRIGDLESSLNLEKGELVILGNEVSSSLPVKTLPLNFESLSRDVNIGERVLIDDGLIELLITEKRGRDIYCKVIEGGLVKSRKGINLPDSLLTMPSLTAKDKIDIAFARDNKLDFLALSFVRKSSDIVELREYLRELNCQIPIIAKIEKPQAIDDIEMIIKKSDAIMIARGDLGVEMSAYEVPILQKQIIHKCLLLNKPVITATQMLESMIHNPRCTRAEASDVANAVFDGTDAVMLSGETSVGSYAVSAVKTMHSILFRSEQTDYLRSYLADDNNIGKESLLAIDLAQAACQMSQNIKSAVIIVMTKTGRTARYLSKFRTKTPIFAYTPNAKTIPLLKLCWGVESVLVDSFGNTDEILAQAKAYAINNGFVEKDDVIVFVTGTPMLETDEVNMIRIDRL